MRKLIGHRPLVLVGAAVLLTDVQGRLLLIHRTDNGCWGIPGGYAIILSRVRHVSSGGNQTQQ